MKKIFSFLVFLLILPLNVVGLNDITENAKSAIMVSFDTGEILYEKNIHERYAPASMTKMMSLVLIMEYIETGGMKLDDKVTVSEQAASMGGSQIFLETGEVMTVNELLLGVSIASGNDATVALAEQVAGSEEEFVKKMNERVKQMSLKNTNFKNSTGLDEANHYSSAYDMAMIAKELARHPLVLQYSGTYEAYLRENTDKKFWLVNTNKLVRFYQGVDGLKTGFTDEAGYCLTATAKRNNMRLITVVMGEPDTTKRSSETSKLLDYGFNTYSVKNIIKSNKSLGKIEVDKGKVIKVDIFSEKDVNILEKKGAAKRNIDYNIKLKKIKAPIKKGEVVGKIQIIEKSRIIQEVNITIKEDVKKANILVLYFRNLSDVITGNINF